MANKINKKESTTDVKKLKLMITIVPHGKKDVIMELIEEFEVNYQLYRFGQGTASNELSSLLGMNTNEKDIIFSVIREDLANDCLLRLEDRFEKIKNGGISFTVPFESIIGSSNYLFLSNLGGQKNE